MKPRFACPFRAGGGFSAHPAYSIISDCALNGRMRASSCGYIAFAIQQIENRTE